MNRETENGAAFAAPFSGVQGKNMRERWKILILLSPLAAVTALVLISCVHVLVQSLGYVPVFGLEAFTLSYYREILSDPSFLQALGVSLRISLCSAALAAVLGTALCAALVGLGKSRGALTYLVRLPILVPHAVTALFTVLLFAQTGLLARLAHALGLLADFSDFPQLLYTSGYTGAILAYVWKEAPFVAYFTLALMANISSTLGEAAENLGAPPLRSFFTVTLPLSLPAISKAFLIIFLFAFGGYELPMLLGATVPRALPVQAYLSYMSPELRDLPYAMAMYGAILLLSLAMAGLYGLLTRTLWRKIRRAGT